MFIQNTEQIMLGNYLTHFVKSMSRETTSLLKFIEIKPSKISNGYDLNSYHME